MLPQPPRMQSLRDQIDSILFSNLTPLQQKLRSLPLPTFSVQQLFETISQEYKQKQAQVSTIGKLILHTIDLLAEEVNEKNDLVRDYEETIEEYKREQEESEAHIEQCEGMLEDYKNRIEDLEVEMMEVKEVRERYQTMYEDELSHHSKEVTAGETFDCSKVEGMEEVHGEERWRMEIGTLEYEVKQLKLEVERKDNQVLRLEQLRNHLNQRMKSQTDKNKAIQDNFKIVQQNFRTLVLENDTLRKIIQELEERGKVVEGEIIRKQGVEETPYNKLEKQNLETHDREEEFFGDELESEQLLRRVVSQTTMKKREGEVGGTQPKKSLAFDLQSLYSGISVFSPRGSERGNFFGGQDKKRVSDFWNSPKSIGLSKQGSERNSFQHVPQPQQSRVKLSSFRRTTPTPLTPATTTATKPAASLKQSPPTTSLARRCFDRVLDFLVVSRIKN